MEEKKEQNISIKNEDVNNGQGTNSINKSKTSLVKWIRIAKFQRYVLFLF